MDEPLINAQFPRGSEADFNQPGLSALRTAVANRAHRALDGTPIRQDSIAGLNSALSSIPDGMASGLLAGVNPIHGLYACMAGPIAGGLLSSSQLMLITTTSAAALGTGQALAHLPFEKYRSIGSCAPTRSLCSMSTGVFFMLARVRSSVSCHCRWARTMQW
ncbi:hypothetical protein GCM10011487_15820 [Steroidobacter agaridevorans]|uniref:SLC26A/SulP transporter domain-containing protein n=1 Tax=Steroidobacter agaridevorans TaxID=2695856 RepID=A0A829YAB8_9GAMM|nr:SulP family inorganic anion transporter [Steroidobacter agaridevorans]GFE79582.1 hypothetical protein GCM10011487_15820 [Steroidobacter agaridevorans]GFE88587.1 hypothetical protein GCM10011488_35410 [Steroidobacter agaridevorans]